MRLTLLGTGSALPSARRFQRELSLSAEMTPFLSTAAAVLHTGLYSPISTIRRSILSSLRTHLDHVADLPTLAKARLLNGYQAFTAVGPEGTHDICGALFDVDDLINRLNLTVRELPTGTDPFVIDDFTIERAPTDHSKPGYAYRIDDRVTIAGDTAPTEPVRSLADGSDVLVHECAYPDGTKSPGHSTPTALGELLADINLDQILLTHIFPETEPHADELINTVSEYTDSTIDVDIATDRTSVTLD